MLSALCGCLQSGEKVEPYEKEGEDPPPTNNGHASSDGHPRSPETVAESAQGDRASNGLDGMLRNDLLSLRARRRLIALDDDGCVSPTVFSSDGEGVLSEDEEGEETLAVEGGRFAGQDYDRLKGR